MTEQGTGYYEVTTDLPIVEAAEIYKSLNPRARATLDYIYANFPGGLFTEEELNEAVARGDLVLPEED